MNENTIRQTQGELARQGLDGWLLYDFHDSNDIAVRLLGLKGHRSRRFFYLIPASGMPIAFIHEIEKQAYENLPGKKFFFFSYRVLEEKLATILSGFKHLAMEYSPGGRLPYVGRVDAGTVELIRSMGIEVVSSADLVAVFTARLNEVQIDNHRRAAEAVGEICQAAFDYIRESLTSGKIITEFDVVQFILDRFKENGMITQYPPMCSVGANAGNPHYEPSAEKASAIEKDQLILIDMWAKYNNPDGIYADITRMAYSGSDIPEKYRGYFTIIAMARDAAIKFLKENWGKRIIYGYEVDDVVRNVLAAEGLDNRLTHRTGHSISDNVHGPGPNIDNMETEDRRKLMSGHLFSIEPGVYFEDCGLRTEINVLVTEEGPEVTTQPVQEEILRLF